VKAGWSALLAPSEAATCADATDVVRPVWLAIMADVASPRRAVHEWAASNHTCVITTSRADDRFVTFTK